MHTDIGVYDSYLAFADIDHSDEMARAIERALGGMPYVAEDWFELNRELFGGRRP